MGQYLLQFSGEYTANNRIVRTSVYQRRHFEVVDDDTQLRSNGVITALVRRFVTAVVLSDWRWRAFGFPGVSGLASTGRWL